MAKKPGEDKPVRCKHALCISVTKLANRLKSISVENDDAWLCLTCGLYCGLQKRAAHGREHNHPLFFQLPGELFWCVNCGQREWPLGHVEQAKLRSHLEEVMAVITEWRKLPRMADEVSETKLIKGEKDGQPKEKLPSRRGLINLGNTCFMNATLQALSVLNLDKLEDATDPLSRALHACLQDLTSSSHQRHPVDPSPFFSLLCRRNREWGRLRQQDAHDFLHALFNALDEVKAEWHREAFAGQISFSVRCNTCRTVSSRVQDTMDLSLGLSPTSEELEEEPQRSRKCEDDLVEGLQRLKLANDPLTKLLAAWSQPVKLEGSNAFACEACGRREGGLSVPISLQPATQTMRLSTMPRILLLHLQRFMTGSRRVEKNNAQLEPPLQLLLNGLVYELRAMVVHEGASVSSGHYVACLRVGTEWYLCSDGRISRLSNPHRHNPYLLFYEQIK